MKKKIDYQQVFDLMEPLSGEMRFRVQPSLKAKFTELCKGQRTGPVDPSDMLRRLMAKWILDERSGAMLLD